MPARPAAPAPSTSWCVVDKSVRIAAAISASLDGRRSPPALRATPDRSSRRARAWRCRRRTCRRARTRGSPVSHGVVHRRRARRLHRIYAQRRTQRPRHRQRAHRLRAAADGNDHRVELGACLDDLEVSVAAPAMTSRSLVECTTCRPRAAAARSAAARRLVVVLARLDELGAESANRRVLLQLFPCGTTTTQATPNLRAAHASPAPWLPRVAAMTPRARFSSSSAAIALTALRTLKALVG